MNEIYEMKKNYDNNYMNIDEKTYNNSLFSNKINENSQ